jgi:5-(carboxyamino)imidazole ribonucleotide mutase
VLRAQLVEFAGALRTTAEEKGAALRSRIAASTADDE